MRAARKFLEDAIEEKKRQLAMVLSVPTRGMDADAINARSFQRAEYPDPVDAPAPVNEPLPLPMRQPLPQPEPVMPDLQMEQAQPVSVDIGPPPNSWEVQRNNKGRPTGVESVFQGHPIGEQDWLQANRGLLKAQQDYKAPHSTKDLLKKLAIGFFTGGLPGAAGSALDYGLNQDTRNEMAVGQDMRRTQRGIQEEVGMRNQQNDWQNDESQRTYRDAQAYRALNPVAPDYNLSPGQSRMRGGKVIASMPDRPTRGNAAPGFTLAPGGARYDGNGKLIAERPGIEKPEASPEVVPDTTVGFARLEQEYRDAGSKAGQYADQQEILLKKYISENPQKFTGSGGVALDPKNDPDAAAMMADISRHREYAQSALSKAEQAAKDRVEAGNRDAIARSKAEAKPTRGKASKVYTEAEVIERGKKYGLTAEQAIEKAKAGGLLR